EIVRKSPPPAKAIPGRFSDVKDNSHVRRLGDTNSCWNELAFFFHDRFFDWAKYESAGTAHPDAIAANALVRLWHLSGEEQDWCEQQEACQSIVKSRSDGGHINWRVHELAADKLLAENLKPTTTKKAWQPPPAEPLSGTDHGPPEALHDQGIVVNTLA